MVNLKIGQRRRGMVRGLLLMLRTPNRGPLLLCTSDQIRSLPAKRRKRKAYNRFSDFKDQLIERKKLTILYGNLTKKQLKKTCSQASQAPGKRNEELLLLLETRLDVVLYRTSFFKTIYSARQWINHNRIAVNGQTVHLSSYAVKPGDVLSVTPKRGTPNVPLNCLESKVRGERVVSAPQSTLRVPLPATPLVARRPPTPPRLGRRLPPTGSPGGVREAYVENRKQGMAPLPDRNRACRPRWERPRSPTPRLAPLLPLTSLFFKPITNQTKRDCWFQPFVKRLLEASKAKKKIQQRVKGEGLLALRLRQRTSPPLSRYLQLLHPRSRPFGSPPNRVCVAKRGGGPKVPLPLLPRSRYLQLLSLRSRKRRPFGSRTPPNRVCVAKMGGGPKMPLSRYLQLLHRLCLPPPPRRRPSGSLGLRVAKQQSNPQRVAKLRPPRSRYPVGEGRRYPSSHPSRRRIPAASRTPTSGWRISSLRFRYLQPLHPLCLPRRSLRRGLFLWGLHSGRRTGGLLPPHYPQLPALRLRKNGIKPLHLEVSYRLLTAIFLYSPQKVPFAGNLDLNLVVRSLR